MSEQKAYYRHPAIRGDRIVFVCEDDLWSVSATGGIARRLTSNPGTVSFPLISPDGKRIAFTGRDEGPTEIYVMDADGGVPRRLTWFGSMTRTAAWTSDSKNVVFASYYGQAMRHADRLYTVSADGGNPQSLIPGPARAISYQPGGEGIVIGRNTGDPARWKRYRGGTAGVLWIDRTGNGNFKWLLDHVKGNLAAPMWIGMRIYFLSDHEGHGNIYSCKPDGKDIRRHTHHEEYYARFPSTDGHTIVYHVGADIWRYDIERDETYKVDIRIHSPQAQVNRRFTPASSAAESADLHPKGHSLALIARGGLFSVQNWGGAPVRHGAVSSVRYRLARWLADGKRMVAIHDEGGEESLVVIEPGKAPLSIKADIGRTIDLTVAPHGGDHAALCNHRYEVIVADLAGGKHKVVERSEFDRIKGLAWSPDGQWLAYGIAKTPRSVSIHLYNVKTGKVSPATGTDFLDYAPAFDPSGKYLYFLSNRFFEPIMDAQNFEYEFPVATKPCLIPLRTDIPSPFASAQREARAPGDDGAKSEKKDEKAGKDAKKKDDKKKDAPEPVKIDLDDIACRVVAFPVPLARYGAIFGIEGKALYTTSPLEYEHWMDEAEGDASAKDVLHVYDFDTEKSEVLISGVSDAQTSLKAKHLLVSVGRRLRVLSASGLSKSSVGTSDAAGRESGWVDLDRVSVEIAPRAEWRQMFREAWRLQRDHFWNSGMSDIDWQNVHDRYLPLVGRCASRAEFSDLMWEMQGELGTSHCYEMGGDYRPEPRYHQGFLGADLEVRGNAWRIARIVRGDSWDQTMSSPLSDPAVNAKEGDEILAVNGISVGRTRSPFESLVNAACANITLRLRSGGKEREVIVRCLRSETMLRYRSWVEGNREAVHKSSKGRIGYVHIPDMGALGFAEFNRYFPREVECDGLIIDVRFNGGGHVSQLLLQRLLRKRIGYDINRWGKPMSYPADAPMGPMAALTNEHAGSDGDMFSHAFKLYKLGPLIGKRTWGGVVGIWPRHALVDGTVTTQPEFSFWFTDVGYGIENYGTDPDIEVDIAPQDFARGHDPQLECGIAEVEKLIRKLKPRIPEFKNRPSLKAPRLSKVKR